MHCLLCLIQKNILIELNFIFTTNTFQQLSIEHDLYIPTIIINMYLKYYLKIILSLLMFFFCFIQSTDYLSVCRYNVYILLFFKVKNVAKMKENSSWYPVVSRGAGTEPWKASIVFVSL